MNNYPTDFKLSEIQNKGLGAFKETGEISKEFYLFPNEENKENIPGESIKLNFIQTNFGEDIDEKEYDIYLNQSQSQDLEDVSSISLKPTADSIEVKKFKETIIKKEKENIPLKESKEIIIKKEEEKIPPKKEEPNSSNSDKINTKNKTKEDIYKVITPKRIDEKSLEEEITQEKIYPFDFTNVDDIRRERFLTRRRRRENKDNIRKKIKRGFLNDYLFNKINYLLKKGKKRHNNFERFPQKFVSDVVKKENNIILNLTLREIIERKELCCNKKDLDNYYHNIKVLESLKNENNFELEKILNTMYQDLFNEYINSDEFKIDEINRLKRKNMTDWYIKNYVNLSKHFIEFFEDI